MEESLETKLEELQTVISINYSSQSILLLQERISGMEGSLEEKTIKNKFDKYSDCKCREKKGKDNCPEIIYEIMELEESHL